VGRVRGERYWSRRCHGPRLAHRNFARRMTSSRSRMSKVRPHATWTTLHSGLRPPKNQRSTNFYLASKTDQTRVFVGPLVRTSLHQRKLKLLGRLAFAARFIPSEHPLTSSRPSLLAFRQPAWREGSYISHQVARWSVLSLRCTLCDGPGGSKNRP